MQYCNMFETRIFKEKFNRVLMQCSYSKHANIIQMWGCNCNKTKLICIDEYHIYQDFLNVQKIKMWIPCHCLCQRNLNNIYMLLSNLKRPLSKTIFMKHHVICSLISSCYNHLTSMLMNVKLIVIQLKLNGMDYKLVYHIVIQSLHQTHDTHWYVSLKNGNQTPKKLHGYEYISSTGFF